MATCNLYHDTRRTTKTGSYPIKIRVTHERKSKFFETSFRTSEKDFEKLLIGSRLDAELRHARKRLDDLLQKANQIIYDLGIFSFDSFTRRFTNASDRQDLIVLVKEKADRLENEGYYANAELYRKTCKILLKFHNTRQISDQILLKDFTPEYLRAFQKWALSTSYIIPKNRDKLNKTYSITTIGMMLIRVKSVINYCIENGELHPARSPFGRNKYVIPKSRASKRPLEHSEIMALANYEIENYRDRFARDMFIFSYVANGMNFYDIAKLKWTDIKKDAFYFVRQKTSAKLPDKQIRVYLNEKLLSIINEHGNHEKNAKYIFNVVPWGATEKVERAKICCFISATNVRLKKMAVILGINPDISTYYARHTFVTMMHEFGASIYTIKDIIGHEDIKSTQSYISNNNKEKIIELQSRLLK